MIARSPSDAVVIGLGIMGAAALFHLARLGLKVVGIDARGPSHVEGSSHGDTRIFRRAYWEGEHYVPLLNRAFDGWLALNEATDQEVCHRTGGLFLGSPKSALVRKSLKTARNCGIEHEALDATEIRARFPAFQIGDDVEGVFEPSALMLFAERARLAFLRQAVAAGATIAYGEPVTAISRKGRESLAVEGRGWSIHCGKAVVTAGAWLPRLLPSDVGAILRPQRIPIFWFDPVPGSAANFAVDRFPLFLLETADGSLVYGLPKWRDVRGGVKIGFHNKQLSDVDLDQPRPPARREEADELWQAFNLTLPGLVREARGTSCIYTMTPDENFIIDRSAEIEDVVFASACSGHGFKFAPAIGEALAQIAANGHSAVDLAAFSLGRFLKAPHRSSDLRSMSTG
jgi:sarcosine oxidase